MPADVAIDPVEQLQERFARIVEEAAREAISARGTFTIAVPGGSANDLLLPALSTASVDWAHTDLFWVDERLVGPGDPESNFGAAKGAWLDRLPIPTVHIHRMRSEEGVPVQAAADYARLLRARAGDPVKLDLVVLGVGSDGHVASLFPGHRLLRVWDREVAVLDDAPKPPPGRMTLTLKVLTAARRVVIFASGRSKAGAVLEALGDEESELPAALVLMGEGATTVLLDPAAASHWSRPPR
jgi:6-phosphogluconolactonase